MVYVLAWLGWWLWKLLVTDDSYAEFPDITEAWEDAMQALQQQRIDLRELPLFLLVGRTEGSMEALFKASRLPLEGRPAPARNDAPLHVFATRDAVYVTCEGASLLGRHAAGLAGEGGEGEANVPTDDDDPLDKTNQPGKAPGAVPEIAAVMARAAPSAATCRPRKSGKIRLLMRQDRVRQPIVRNAAEVELLGARFEHLCRLLVRDRWPYCPINGMLVLLPFAATDTDQDALDAAAACQRDLSVARRVLQVNCPTLAMVCDLETAPGFAAFLEQFPEKQRQQRIGQRSPMAPALETRGRAGDAEARTAMLESLAQWICASVAPGWVYKHFRMESADATAGVPAGPALSRTDPMEASRAGKGPRRGAGRADVFRHERRAVPVHAPPARAAAAPRPPPQPRLHPGGRGPHHVRRLLPSRHRGRPAARTSVRRRRLPPTGRGGELRLVDDAGAGGGGCVSTLGAVRADGRRDAVPGSRRSMVVPVVAGAVRAALNP